MSDLYIGLMSGTSLDGADGVLVDFGAGAQSAHIRFTVLAHAHQPFAASHAAELLALNSTGQNELHRAALAGNALARCYADVVAALLHSAKRTSDEVRAIGAHGQTVRHQPQAFDGTGYTVQLNSPALLAELSGITVVADFRSRDVAAGGQGAPLVPGFHRAVFGRDGVVVAVLNLGGISNLTVLGADGATFGFDCGPANALMDHWCRAHTGRPFDDAGAWAASGTVVPALLSGMLADPYFALRPPKSTGRDLFHPAWLQHQLAGVNSVAALPAKDVQATLAEFTAQVCANEVQRFAADASELLVCGGGALNAHLMQRLSALLPGIRVLATDERGLPANQVEACAFAWLARAFEHRECGNLSAVTGAAGPRILGALYPAR